MSDLCRGWALAAVGDIAEINVGFAFKSAEYTLDGVRLLRGENVEPGALRWTDTRYWPEAGAQVLSHHLVRPGDLILAMDRPVVSAGLKLARARASDCPCLLVQRVARLRGFQGTTEILHHALSTPAFVRHILVGGQTGTQLPHISGKRIEIFEFPLPPLEEQRRLSAAIDSYLSRLDDAVATLERVERNLKRYRASVLKSAVEGRLVPTEAALAKQEGRTYEPASVLLERILTERRRRWSESGKKGKYQEPTPPDTTNLPKLPEGWCWANVEQLTTGERTSGYGVLVPGPDVPDGVLLIRVGDIRDGRVHVGEIKRIAKSIADKFQRTYLRGNELLLSLVGSIGRTAVVPASLAGANVARAVGVIPITSIIDCRWVEHWFRSPLNQSRIVGLAHEVARKTLNLEDVRCAVVALPPRLEQTRIVEMVSDLESTFDKSSRLVELSRQRSGRLRQSILKWAFEGKLADQDPTDEPASVLLERIKAERTTSKPAKLATPQRKAAKKRARA